MSTPGKFKIASFRSLNPSSAVRAGLIDDEAAVESSTNSDGWLLFTATGTKIRFSRNSAGISAALPPNAKRAGAGACWVGDCWIVIREFANELGGEATARTS